jgi:hypothetical protein
MEKYIRQITTRGEHKTSLTTLTPTQNTSSYENNVPNQQNNEQISPATHITQSDIQQINFNTTQKKRSRTIK